MNVGGGGEESRPLLKIVLEVVGTILTGRPEDASAAPVVGGRLRIVRWIDEVVRFLAAQEPQHVLQRGLHRAPSLARDEGRYMRRHDDVRKILERTMERPSVLRVGVCPPRVEGGPKPRTGFEMFEQLVFDDQPAAGDG